MEKLPGLPLGIAPDLAPALYCLVISSSSTCRNTWYHWLNRDFREFNPMELSMGLSRSLRNELFKYRKRNRGSLAETVTGLEQGRGRVTPVSVDLGSWGPPPQEYVPRPAQSYHPHPGFPDFPEPQYDPHLPEPHTNHTTPEMWIGPPAIPAARPEAASLPDYDGLPMTDGLLALALRESESLSEPDPIPVDHAIMADELVQGPAMPDSVAPETPNWDPCQEIEAAIDQQIQQAAAPPEMPQPDPMPGPAEMQQMTDEQLQQLMNPLGMPGQMGPGPMM